MTTYPLAPRNLDKETWFYEEPKGMTFVRQVRQKGTGTLIAATMFTVPWRRLESAVDRHRKTKRKRGAR